LSQDVEIDPAKHQRVVALSGIFISGSLKTCFQYQQYSRCAMHHRLFIVFSCEDGHAGSAKYFNEISAVDKLGYWARMVLGCCGGTLCVDIGAGTA
jgi:hypothetical protein